MLKITIDLMGLHTWCGNDHRAVIDLVQLADQKGIDHVCLGDHVIMGEDLSSYPFGKFSAPLDFPWLEPLIELAAIAAATTRIRLTTGILLAPLRPAVLLAKQLASLDVLSNGRVDIGLGTGWQKAEYDASNVPFEKRVELLYEHVRVCKELWRHAPASFQGDAVSFDRLHSFPQPTQPGGIPVWFGVPPTAKNCMAMAELGDGWLPLGITLEQTAAGVERIRAAYRARGRDPLTLEVGHILIPEFRPDGSADLEQAWEQVPAWQQAGVTMLRLFPTMFCRGRDDFERFVDQAIALRSS